MLRVNLSGKLSVLHTFKPWKALSIGLALLLAVQIGILYQGRLRRDQNREETASLQSRLQNLEQQEKALILPNDSRNRAGAVNALNDWHREKPRTPAQALAKLEQNRASVCELTRFEADHGNGSLKALVPDTDTAIRWLNAAFPGAAGRMTIEERRNGKLTVAFSWTE